MRESAHPRRHAAFAAVATGTFMSTLDGSAVNVALPTLAQELGGGLALIEWVVLGYLLAIVSLLFNMGRLADLFGSGRIYALGLGIFALASASCAAAPSIPFLIGARIVQGIGGAMINAAGPAILMEVYPAEQRGRILGASGLAVSAGLAAGPAIGGAIVEFLSWHWIFLPNVPLGVIAALVVLRVLPGDGRRKVERFDWPGSILLAASLSGLTLGLSLAGRRGFGDPLALALAGAALLFGLVFLLVEARAEAPVVDLRLFRNRLLAGSAAAGLLIFVTVGATNLVMPFFLEGVMGLETGEVGLLLTALPLALAISAPLAGWATDKALAPRTVATTGALLATATLLALAKWGAAGGPAGIALCLAGIGLAVGIFQTPNNTVLMGAVPRERLGTAGGLVATVRVTGMLVGNAVGASVFAAAGGAASERGLITASLVGAGAGFLAAIASLARGRLPAPLAEAAKP